MEVWWESGVRFECQGSGKCCVSRGDYGYVYLNFLDRQRLAKYFKLSTLAFTRMHCEKTDGWFHLKEPGKTCKFLDGKRCSIYEARPTQCRTWPFWPRNMSPKAWSTEVASYCPGVGKGKLVTADEIRGILKQSNTADTADTAD